MMDVAAEKGEGDPVASSLTSPPPPLPPLLTFLYCNFTHAMEVCSYIQGYLAMPLAGLHGAPKEKRKDMTSGVAEHEANDMYSCSWCRRRCSGLGREAGGRDGCTS